MRNLSCSGQIDLIKVTPSSLQRRVERVSSLSYCLHFIYVYSLWVPILVRTILDPNYTGHPVFSPKVFLLISRFVFLLKSSQEPRHFCSGYLLLLPDFSYEFYSVLLFFPFGTLRPCPSSSFRCVRSRRVVNRVVPDRGSYSATTRGSFPSLSLVGLVVPKGRPVSLYISWFRPIVTGRDIPILVRSSFPFLFSDSVSSVVLWCRDSRHSEGPCTLVTPWVPLLVGFQFLFYRTSKRHSWVLSYHRPLSRGTFVVLPFVSLGPRWGSRWGRTLWHPTPVQWIGDIQSQGSRNLSSVTVEGGPYEHSSTILVLVFPGLCQESAVTVKDRGKKLESDLWLGPGPDPWVTTLVCARYLSTSRVRVKFRTICGPSFYVP